MLELCVPSMGLMLCELLEICLGTQMQVLETLVAAHCPNFLSLHFLQNTLRPACQNPIYFRPIIEPRSKDKWPCRIAGERTQDAFVRY